MLNPTSSLPTKESKIEQNSEFFDYKSESLAKDGIIMDRSKYEIFEVFQQIFFLNFFRADAEKIIRDWCRFNPIPKNFVNSIKEVLLNFYPHTNSSYRPNTLMKELGLFEVCHLTRKKLFVLIF